MILLLNSSNLSRTQPFQRGFFQFWTTNQEQPKSTFAQEKRELERFLLQLMRNQAKSTRTGQLYKKGSTFRWTTLFSITIHFFVSPIRVSLFSLTVSPGNQIENCGSVETFFGSRQKTSAVYQSAMKISWHPHHPIYPLRLWVSELESTSIERERSLVLCFGQGQIEMQ